MRQDAKTYELNIKKGLEKAEIRIKEHIYFTYSEAHIKINRIINKYTKIATDLNRSNEKSIKAALTLLSPNDEKQIIRDYIHQPIKDGFHKRECGEIIISFIQQKDSVFQKREIEMSMVIDTHPLFEITEFDGKSLTASICLDYHLMDNIALFMGSKEALRSLSPVSEAWYIRILATWDVLEIHSKTRSKSIFRVPALVWDSPGTIMMKPLGAYTKLEARHIREHVSKKTRLLIINDTGIIISGEQTQYLLPMKNLEYLYIAKTIDGLLVNSVYPKLRRYKTKYSKNISAFLENNPQIEELEIDCSREVIPILIGTSKLKTLIISGFKEVLYLDKLDLGHVESLQFVEGLFSRLRVEIIDNIYKKIPSCPKLRSLVIFHTWPAGYADILKELETQVLSVRIQRRCGK